MKAALQLKRLPRLEGVRAADPRPVELQFGYVEKLPADYTENFTSLPVTGRNC